MNIVCFDLLHVLSEVISTIWSTYSVSGRMFKRAWHYSLLLLNISTFYIATSFEVARYPVSSLRRVNNFSFCKQLSVLTNCQLNCNMPSVNLRCCWSHLYNAVCYMRCLSSFHNTSLSSHWHVGWHLRVRCSLVHTYVHPVNHLKWHPKRHQLVWVAASI